MLYCIEEKMLRGLVNTFGLCEEMDYGNYKKIKETLFNCPIDWQKNLESNAELFPYVSQNTEFLLKLRINLSSASPNYTLLENDKAIISFDELPTTWNIP